MQGAKGGFIATVLMTVYRIPLFQALPPTAEFWAQYVTGGSAADHTAAGYLLHALYGTVGGAVFGAVLPSIGRRWSLERETTALFSGSVFSLVLSLFGVYVVFHHLLDRELEDDHKTVFHVGHLIYGLTLGTWLGKHERTGDVYDTPTR